MPAPSGRRRPVVRRVREQAPPDADQREQQPLIRAPPRRAAGGHRGQRRVDPVEQRRRMRRRPFAPRRARARKYPRERRPATGRRCSCAGVGQRPAMALQVEDVEPDPHVGHHRARGVRRRPRPTSARRGTAMLSRPASARRRPGPFASALARSGGPGRDLGEIGPAGAHQPPGAPFRADRADQPRTTAATSRCPTTSAIALLANTAKSAL